MEILDKQKQKIQEVAKRYGLKLILLFGSQVTGKIHKESDFDIAYLPKKNLSYDDKIDINFQFTLIFPQERYRVDTVNIKKVKPLLLYGIFRKCQVLYAQDDLIFPTYRVYAFRKYMEIKPFLEKQFKNKLKSYDI
ncbi:MAG: polymerase beta domain protein region protein [Parcubacteria group bacterium GW2011_GWA2_37_10]|nr:MAG: polymerase beta domain protein region protein [Parcubacteria group bacterium GW2011_GWA2_37_10]